MKSKRTRPSRSWTILSIAIVVAVVASMVISALIPDTRTVNSDSTSRSTSSTAAP